MNDCPALTMSAVQGSTDGIGKELAKQLAKKGLNIVLVGRSPSKLEAAEKEVNARIEYARH